MAALASSDVTLTISERRIVGKKRRNIVKIQFGDGALTIPAGGVPMPSAASFGMVRSLDFLTVFDDNDASGYLWKYDKDNNKLRAYRSAGFTPAGTNSAPAFTGTASTASKLQTYSPGGGDIKGSATTNVGIAGGALQTNGQLLSNLADAANTTNFTIALNPDVPRNIGIAFKNTNAGASTGNAVSCVITGTFRGSAQTETISFSALELTSTVQNEVATKYGSKPFDTITSITNPVAQPANWQHAAGPGSKLGLPLDLKTPAEADVTKLTQNAAHLAVTGLVDTANMTVNFGALSDGDDVSVQYNVLEAAITPVGTVAAPAFTGSAVAAGVLVEDTTSAPAAQTLYCEAVGW